MMVSSPTPPDASGTYTINVLDEAVEGNESHIASDGSPTIKTK